MKQVATVVIDDVEPSWPRANFEIQVLMHREWRPSDLRPRRPRHEIKHAIIVAGLGEVADKALWLAEVHSAIVPLPHSGGLSAHLAGGSIGVGRIDVLAVAAQSDAHLRTKRVRIQHRQVALT